ncbi:hypothetical protein BT69DRAFT_794038 [Atractiella rhizophila]|nr:hypothetical protein BT69DRAFT_794038 [Atractiella rhizophila]
MAFARAYMLLRESAGASRLQRLLHKLGAADSIVHCLNTSDSPEVLGWAARAVGCLMRPNSADMAKALLEAGAAKGLARLPRVLPTEEVAPLESFAFTIQRFCAAEWGDGTRKALVNAGVVDSLLAALRTAADVPAPNVHKELAHAISFLGDVGGGELRKEIQRAGGVDILKKVGASGNKDVAKACSIAVTTMTGNIFTRNTGLSCSPLLPYPRLLSSCDSISENSYGS